MELWGWVVVHGCSVQGIVHEISLTHIHYTHPKSNIEKQVPVYVAQTAERSIGQRSQAITGQVYVCPFHLIRKIMQLMLESESEGS